MELWSWVCKEWRGIWAARKGVGALLVLAVVAVWFVLNWNYSRMLATHQANEQFLRDQIEAASRGEETNAEATPEPPLTPQNTATRHYSSADKDEIANAFIAVSKILESEARPLYKLGNDLLFAWGKDKDLGAAMAALSDYQQKCGVLSADLDRVYSKQFSNYQTLLEGVLAFDGNANPIGFAKDRAGDLYADMHDINEVLAKNPDAPKDTLVGLAHRAAETLQAANNKLRAWMYETKDRLEAAKMTILVDK